MKRAQYYGLWLLLIPTMPLVVAGLSLLLHRRLSGYYLLAGGFLGLWIVVNAILKERPSAINSKEPLSKPE